MANKSLKFHLRSSVAIEMKGMNMMMYCTQMILIVDEVNTHS